MWTDPRRLRAVQMLVLANAGWALSFPTVKALLLVQQPLLPDASTWFLTSLTVAYRFGLAALLLTPMPCTVVTMGSKVSDQSTGAPSFFIRSTRKV